MSDGPHAMLAVEGSEAPEPPAVADPAGGGYAPVEGAAAGAGYAAADTAGAILRTIACAAEQEAQQVLQEADRDAAATLEAARGAVRARVEAACNAAEAGAHVEAARRLNAVRLRLVHRRARVGADALDAAFEAAASRLELLASGAGRARWSAALERYVREALALTGSGSTIETRPVDTETVAAAARALDAGVTVRDDPGLAPGLIAHSADGRIEVDATLPTRLERARTSLAGQLAASLGLEG